jgi:hypothetical protein
VSDPAGGLRSVNWMTGMLLTPEHFLRQDGYIDESLGWVLRHCVAGAGLVGGGVRLESGQRGLPGFDPRVELSDDGSVVRVSVLQARGITTSGEMIDIGDGDVVRGEFAKGSLAGASDLLVFVVRTGEREEDPATVGADPFNPDQAAFRRVQYRVSLGAVADVVPHALVVGQVRRVSETLGFELDGHFVPACATVLAHSALYAAWGRLQSELKLLAGQYAELHRTVARYVDQIERRGVDVRADRDTLAFIERAVLALDNAAYETLDPAMPPHRLFQQIDRCGRRIALALDLSPSTREYFQLLAGADASYTALLEEERSLLATSRELGPREDLRRAIATAEQTLASVRRLVEALEGKYLDFRINRSMDALRFLLDRGGEHFYMAVATPGHPQRDADLLTLVFSQLNLAGRHEYRIVLFGDPNGVSAWQVGDQMRVDLRINSAAGPSRPISQTVVCEIPGQRNFAVNFDTPPDVAAISGVQLTVQPAHRVRGAVLYQRKLGLASDDGRMAAPRIATPVAPPIAPPAPSPASPLVTPTPTEPKPAGGPPVIKLRKPNQP